MRQTKIDPSTMASINGFFEQLGISASSHQIKPPTQPVQQGASQPAPTPIFMPGLSANTKLISK